MKKILILVLLSLSSLFAQITFDADFESGNLKSVYTTDSTVFNVETNEDIGGRWFYFRISGVENKSIRVNVITSPHDFTKAMYSYDDKSFIRFSDEESPQSGSFEKLFEKDTVYVSYYTPYTFSMLQERITDWKNNDYVKVDTLGYSPSFLPMQEMVITDHTIPDDEKQSIWIHARTHPGESPSSWHFEGIINELLSGDEAINYYLTKLKFHLIPFVNPDGVFYGHSRTNRNYIDLEREWDKDASSTSPEVQILKGRMKELSDVKPFSVFLNLHSQAASHCLFWIHTAGSTSPSFYTREYQFSNLNMSDNPYFMKGDNGESSLKSHFPEGWLWDNYGDQVMALTYETPYNNYFRNSSEPFTEVTTDNLFEIGRRTVYAIAEYLEISHSHHYIMDNNIAQFTGDDPIPYTVTNEFYGEDFDVLGSDKVIQAELESEELPSGIYDVAGWWATSEANSFETEFEIVTADTTYQVVKTQRANGGQWNYLTTIKLNTTGTISIKTESNFTGLVVVDAFRLIHVGSITDVNDTDGIPNSFILYQNYPNPFNPSTTIRYSIPNVASNFSSSKKVNLVIYDILGKKIQTLVRESQVPGEYEVTFNALEKGNLTSGSYFYRLQIGDNIQTKKMILLK